VRWVVYGSKKAGKGAVRGITELVTVNTGPMYKIESAHSEFNNLMYLANVNKCANCAAILPPAVELESDEDPMTDGEDSGGD